MFHRSTYPYLKFETYTAVVANRRKLPRACGLAEGSAATSAPCSARTFRLAAALPAFGLIYT